MPKKARVVSEDIFRSSQLTPLAIKWKELVATNRDAEAMQVLEQIVIGSTAMFERLAMHENYHYTVDLSILVAAAQEKVVTWLLHWEVGKGRLFTFFSTCAKNAFRSELVKVNQFRKRYYVTSDNLEQFYGQDDHEVNKHDLAAEVRTKIEDISCRWGDPQEIGAIKYHIECIVDEEVHSKQRAIWGAAYAYGISTEMSKFFYTWALSALRHAMYDKIYRPYTKEDLIRASESYTQLPDLIDNLGFDKVSWIIAVYGGQRIKVPTIARMAKLSEDYKLFRELERSDLTPEAFEKIARENKKTLKAAQDVYQDMAGTLDGRRFGEHSVYDAQQERDY